MIEKVDLEYSESLQGKEACIAKDNELTSKEKQRVKISGTVTSAEASKEVVDDDPGDVEYQPCRKKKKDTITLEVPRNILADPEVTAMLDRTKCTNRVTTGVVASVLKASGANLSLLFPKTLSGSTETRRGRLLLSKLRRILKRRSLSMHACTGMVNSRTVYLDLKMRDWLSLLVELHISLRGKSLVFQG